MDEIVQRAVTDIKCVLKLMLLSSLVPLNSIKHKIA